MFKIGKCVLTFYIIFMMCPSRILPALAEHKQDYYHARRVRFPTTSRYKKDTMKGIIHDEVRKDANVAGFDLTDEEIIKFKIWPHGVIPYYIDVLSFKDKVLRDRIRGFLNVVNGLTGLNFLELLVPPQDEKKRWIFFINRRGLLDCADHSIKNFTNEGVQQVILGYDCMNTRGELAEAVLAIAGLPPQHNAPNRDDYIQVVEDSIMPDKRYLFEKLNDNEWLFHDIAYDFYSAGHYHSHKYSANGRATIETQRKLVDIPVGEVEVVQSGNELSNSDILKIKMLYSYISKKKQAHIPECHKLFQPGKHFSSFKPINSIISPQKKPNKYLGIPNDEKNVAEDAKNDAGDDQNDDHYSNDRLNDNQNTKNEENDEDNQSNKEKETVKNIDEEDLNNSKNEQLKDSVTYIYINNTGNKNSKKRLEHNKSFETVPIRKKEMKSEYSGRDDEDNQPDKDKETQEITHYDRLKKTRFIKPGAKRNKNNYLKKFESDDEDNQKDKETQEIADDKRPSKTIFVRPGDNR